MNGILTALIITLVATSAGLFAWYAICIGRQITYITLADGRQQTRKIPLAYRLLLPLAQNLRKFVEKPDFQSARDHADAMIITAGFEGLLSGWEILSLKILLPTCFGPIWILAIHAGTGKFTAMANSAIMLDIMTLTLLYLHPVLWLRSAAQKRQREIIRGLPFVLDLLTLSVEAGMDFMTAMQRNVERRRVDALGEELMRVIREIQLGSPRRVALKAMSTRVNIPDMRSVVNALVQADELGVSIGAILRIQSDQIRQRRFERAERLANEAAVKLLGPLLFFIFPSVFLILLGPAIYRLMQTI